MPHSHLDAWTLADDAFPVGAGDDEKLRHCIRYAVLAPSGHNTQPWRFHVEGSCIELEADRTRALPVVDPYDRELTISCGAALFNLRVALDHFGLRHTLSILPEGPEAPLLARVCLDAQAPAREDDLLFESIKGRRTYRQPFDEEQLRPEVMRQLADDAAREGAWLLFLNDPTQRMEVAALVAEGDRRQANDARFRRELSHWIRPNLPARADGIPGRALGIGGVASWLGPAMTKWIHWGDRQAKKDARLALHAPALAVVGTAGDAPEDWLRAGQALERVLLRARRDGVYAAYLNQPIEVTPLRARLRRLVGEGGEGGEGAEPQLLLRLGHAAEIAPTPRRPLEQVLNAGDARR